MANAISPSFAWRFEKPPFCLRKTAKHRAKDFRKEKRFGKHQEIQTANSRSPSATATARGQKICKAKTITVPDSVKPRGISQYVAHEAEELERLVKSGFAEDRDTTFEAYAARWLERQVKYAPGTLASYRRMLERVYPYIGAIKLGELRPMALENCS